MVEKLLMYTPHQSWSSRKISLLMNECCNGLDGHGVHVHVPRIPDETIPEQEVAAPMPSVVEQTMEEVLHVQMSVPLHRTQQRTTVTEERVEVIQAPQERIQKRAGVLLGEHTQADVSVPHSVEQLTYEEFVQQAAGRLMALSAAEEEEEEEGRTTSTRTRNTDVPLSRFRAGFQPMRMCRRFQSGNCPYGCVCVCVFSLIIGANCTPQHLGNEGRTASVCQGSTCASGGTGSGLGTSDRRCMWSAPKSHHRLSC